MGEILRSMLEKFLIFLFLQRFAFFVYYPLVIRRKTYQNIAIQNLIAIKFTGKNIDSRGVDTVTPVGCRYCRA